MGIMESLLRETLELQQKQLAAPDVVLVPLTQLQTRTQPRRFFDPVALNNLAESVKNHGILQPLLVVPLSENSYQIVAGERRYRAAQIAGLAEVPAVILTNKHEKEIKAIALIENLQRQNLNPYEETIAILELLAIEIDLSVEEVRRLLFQIQNYQRGFIKNPPSVSPEVILEFFKKLNFISYASFLTTRLPLLRLPDDLQEALQSGRISYNAAIVLKKVPASERSQLIESVAQGMSIRQLRKHIKHINNEATSHPPVKTFHESLLKRIKKINWNSLSDKQQQELHSCLDNLHTLLNKWGL